MPVPRWAVDAIMAAAIRAGWPDRSAFEAALLLLVHGTPVAEAITMFDAARRCDSERRRTAIPAGSGAAVPGVRARGVVSGNAVYLALSERAN